MQKSLLVFALILGGCSGGNHSQKEDATQVAVAQLRTDIEDLKHELNSFEIEHHILEGKMTDLEGTMIALQDDSRAEALKTELSKVESRLKQLKKQQGEMVSDIRQLSNHANDTTTALTQYKERIGVFEKHIASIARPSHVVQNGESLEKIARKYNTSVDALKKENNLNDDLIYVGDELSIPQIERK